MISKTKFIPGVCILLVILLSLNVLGFGVASLNPPFTLAPGESKTNYLWLQNMVGEDDITIKAEIVKGQDIASLIGSDTFLVKAHTKDTQVPIQITVDKDTPLNTSYGVSMLFSEVTSGSGEGVSLGTGIGKSFTVLVISEEKQTPLNATSSLIWIIAVAIIIIIAVIVVLVRRAKQQET